MTTKILSGTYASGYTVHSPVNVLSITSSGYVGGPGLTTNVSKIPFTIVNDGKVASTGDGVTWNASSSLTNGSASDTAASIVGALYGVYDRNGSNRGVANFGTIRSTDTTSHAGVSVQGGMVANGGATSYQALIEGYDAVVSGTNAAGTVINFGTIRSTRSKGAGAYGVLIDDGGSVTNGSVDDTYSARILGPHGVAIFGGSGTVVNYGSIKATSLGAAVVNDYAGVALHEGGVVFNGAAGQTDNRNARIAGATGVEIYAAPGQVTNFGLILGSGPDGVGVALAEGGTVTNGNGLNTIARIIGHQGGVSLGAVGTVTNYGTILGDSSAYLTPAVAMRYGGVLINGSASDTRAFIAGYEGLGLAGVTASNFGTIQGTSGDGVFIRDGSVFTNQKSGLVEGLEGSTVSGGSTFDNFGTVTGAFNNALVVEGATSTLMVEAGSVFLAPVFASGGGTIDLASGKGTITALNASAVTVTGSVKTTTFQAFTTVEVGAGASFIATPNLTVASGDTLVVAGTLTTAKAVSVSGSLVASGTLAGAGTLALSGAGQATFASGASLTLANVTQSSGASQLSTAPGANLAYAGVVKQTAGAITAGSGGTITFTGVGDVFDGTLNGKIVLGGGTQSLIGTTINGNVTLQGGSKAAVIGAVHFGFLASLSVNAGTLSIGAAGANLTGGFVALETGGVITGASATNTLTNVSAWIDGVGALGAGHLTLINQAGGMIIASDTSNPGAMLTVDTGAVTITNAGTMVSYSGGMVIKSAVNNTGVLSASGGALTVNATVTGAGTVSIAAARAKFTSAFNENVAFVSPGILQPFSGTLELARSQSYTGTVSGLDAAGACVLDLDDIAFGGSTKATYAGDATGGVLTVTDGVHSAHIALAGDYTAASFVVASDGHGGTSVHDPAKAAPRAFVDAMARLSAPAGADGPQAPAPWRRIAPLLAAPGAHIA